MMIDRIEDDPRYSILVERGVNFSIDDGIHYFADHWGECSGYGSGDPLDFGPVLEAAWQSAGENTLVYQALYSNYIADKDFSSAEDEERQYEALNESFEKAWKALLFEEQLAMIVTSPIRKHIV